MAKKKTSPVVYSTPINTSQINPIVQQTIAQIPPYEDQGISYKGYFKVKKSDTEYQLKPQGTRTNVASAGNLNDGVTGSGTRAFNTLRFYATGVLIQWHGLTTHGATTYVVLSDRSGTNNSARVFFIPTTDDGNIFLDLSNCPRLFEGTEIAITPVGFNMGVNGFIAFGLFGWEEEK